MVPLAFPFRTALLKNIEHFTHQSLYKIAHPERFFKIIPASSALQQFVFWPQPRPPRPDSDLTHAGAPLQVSCWPNAAVVGIRLTRQLSGDKLPATELLRRRASQME